MSKVNINGVWKDLDKVFVNIGGIWKEAEKMFCNIGGVWKEVEGLSSIRVMATGYINNNNVYTYFVREINPTTLTTIKVIASSDSNILPSRVGSGICQVSCRIFL